MPSATENVFLEEDRLPQPYRMLDKLVNLIVDRAWEVIDQKKSAVAPLAKLSAEAVVLKPNASLAMKPPTAEAMAVLDMDTYVGREDGCVERKSAIFDDSNLVSKALHDAPVKCLTGYHITSPVVASSDGVEAKVVCFPIAPIVVRKTSMTMSRDGKEDADAKDEGQPAEEKERMLTILHLTPADFVAQGFEEGAYSIERMWYSPGGRYLAMAVAVTTAAGRVEKVLIYDLGDTDYEKHDAAPEVSKIPMAVLSDNIPDAGSPLRGSRSRPGTAATGGTDAAKPEKDVRPVDVRAEVFFLPSKDFEEYAEAHSVAVVWIGGHTATVRSLRTLPHLQPILEQYDALRTNIINEIQGTVPADAGGDKKKAPPPPKGTAPPSGASRRPVPVAPPPVTTGERIFSFPSPIHATCLSQSLELLAVGCANGVLRVIDVFTHTTAFATTVEPRRLLRKESPRSLNCLSLAIWGHKYIASAWGFGEDEGSDVTIHDMAHGQDPSVGDWVEACVHGRWVPALVRAKESTTAKKKGGWVVVLGGQQEVKLPAGVGGGPPAELRRVSLVGRIRGLPLVSKVYFLSQAPLLFWVTGEQGLSVYDLQARQVKATLPFTKEVVLGAGVAQGLPMMYTHADVTSLTGLVLAAAVVAAAVTSAGPPAYTLRTGGVELPSRHRIVSAPLCAQRAFLSTRSIVPYADGLALYTAAYKASGKDPEPKLAVICHTLSMVSVVRAVYPVLGEEFSSLTGAENIYHLLCSSYHKDLHDEEYVNNSIRLITAPHPERRRDSAMSLRSGGGGSFLSGKGLSRRGSQQMSMAGKSAISGATTAQKTQTKKLAFGATTDKSSVVTDAKSRQLLGANARCLAYKEEKKREKNVRKHKVTAMLQDLQNMFM
eukprot:TRINITY_DN432_c0_g2_i1.p1 TRINITY_DN432_c0_g2~~TRINITY_DN432_c0_g2_i1.p1  ORF type:complete len:883 (+),score=285.00 TRINITY_DN432_c0_g2_i1:84-2732(+)